MPSRTEKVGLVAVFSNGDKRLLHMRLGVPAFEQVSEVHGSKRSLKAPFLPRAPERPAFFGRQQARQRRRLPERRGPLIVRAGQLGRDFKALVQGVRPSLVVRARMRGAHGKPARHDRFCAFHHRGVGAHALDHQAVKRQAASVVVLLVHGANRSARNENRPRAAAGSRFAFGAEVRPASGIRRRRTPSAL